MGLNIAHMLAEGGLAHYVNLAETRSTLLYDAIDKSGGFYLNKTDTKYRSKINVPFRIKPDSGESSDTYCRLEEKFLVDAAKEGLLSLKGHTETKGLRASMYNAMPVEGVNKLVDFMQRFQEANEAKGEAQANPNIESSQA